MSDVDHTSRDHAQLGASSSYRWWNCPGCFRMSSELGAKGSASIYALEGTAAHELCHACLLSDKNAIEFLGLRLGVDSHDFYVDDEMSSAVQVYLDTCRVYANDPDWECLTEHKFNLNKLNPPAPMFGTADFVAINRITGKVVVIDFKYGKGVIVKIQDNPQLKYYAVGVLCALPSDVKVREIETVVVQARLSPHPKTATYKAIDLFQWALELLEHAKATQDPNAQCTAGDWCRSTFCPASGQCPAEAAAAFSAAQIDFDGEVLNGEVIPPQKLPEVRRMTPQELGALKKNFEVLKGFMASVDEVLAKMVENGVEGTGWKLVSGLGHRQWLSSDQNELAKDLINDLALDPEETHVTRIVSPAEAQKVAIGKLRTIGVKAKDAEILVKQRMEKLTVRPQTSPKLVAEANERPALPARGAEFYYEELPAISNN